MSLPRFLRYPEPGWWYWQDYVVLDVETTNLYKGDASIQQNRLILSCYKRGSHDKTVSVWAGEYDAGEVAEAVESAEFLVAHNAKMELKWLHRMGVDIGNLIVFDTMIAEKTLISNRRAGIGLGDVAQRRGFGGKAPYVDILMKKGICPSEIPRVLLETRCKKDVEQTEAIFLQQRKELKDMGLLPVFFTRCMLTPVLADMELRGLVLDKDRVVEEYRASVRKKQQLEAELADYTQGRNLNSNKQLGELLYDELGFDELTRRGEPIRTPAGARKADQATIQKLRVKNNKQQRFIGLFKDLNKVNARISKSLESFKRCVDNDDRLYAQFNQCVTDTGRLSSSGINYGVQFQNLPREYKKLFRSRHCGWLMGEIDGAQLEFRTAAYQGSDRRAAEDIRNDEDVHSYTAAVLTEAGQPTDRQGAKPHTFKPLYGGQSGTKAEQEYYKAFREKYPGITTTQESWKREALTNKQLKVSTGFIFYFPDTYMTRDGYIANSTKICNYPVQYLATGEIIPIAVVHLWHRMRAEQMTSFLVNTVHDSAIAELHPDEVEAYYEIAHQAFTHDTYSYMRDVYDITFDVPLGTGFKVAEHWGDTDDERKAQEEPPVKEAA